MLPQTIYATTATDVAGIDDRFVIGEQTLERLSLQQPERSAPGGELPGGSLSRRFDGFEKRLPFESDRGRFGLIQQGDGFGIGRIVLDE